MVWHLQRNKRIWLGYLLPYLMPKSEMIDERSIKWILLRIEILHQTDRTSWMLVKNPKIKTTLKNCISRKKQVQSNRFLFTSMKDDMLSTTWKLKLSHKCCTGNEKSRLTLSKYVLSAASFCSWLFCSLELTSLPMFFWISDDFHEYCFVYFLWKISSWIAVVTTKNVR